MYKIQKVAWYLWLSFHRKDRSKCFSIETKTALVFKISAEINAKCCFNFYWKNTSRNCDRIMSPYLPPERGKFLHYQIKKSPCKPTSANLEHQKIKAANLSTRRSLINRFYLSFVIVTGVLWRRVGKCATRVRLTIKYCISKACIVLVSRWHSSDWITLYEVRDCYIYNVDLVYCFETKRNVPNENIFYLCLQCWRVFIAYPRKGTLLMKHHWKFNLQLPVDCATLFKPY